MSGQTLRQKFMRRFSGMDKYSRETAWLIVASYAVQVVAAIAAGHYVLGLAVTPWTLLAMALLATFIGTRLRGFNNIVHECSHATFTKDRADNVKMGSVCASFVLGCYSDYRDEHLTHHAHLGDYEHDMDLHGLKDLRLHEPLTRANVVRHLTNPLLGRHLPYYLGVNLSARDGRMFQWGKIGLLAAAALFTVIAPLTALFFVIVPFVLVYSTINYWTDCLDHAGLLASEDELDSSRNILAPLPLRVILFPRNDCFHLVHHLFPQIPARHLEACHETLASDRLYQSKKHAIRPKEAPALRPEIAK